MRYAMLLCLTMLCAGCADPVGPKPVPSCYVTNIVTHQNDYFPVCPVKW